MFGFDIPSTRAALKECGQGLPPETYFSEAIFEIEHREIFGRRWTCFAPLARLSRPGSAVVGHVGRIPIVVTRDADGKLHGFINACRHRGYPVAEEDMAECKKLTCRYHSWTYRLSGELVAAPDSAPGFEKASHGLLPVSVACWGQFVFVNPDPRAEPFEVALPTLTEAAQRMRMELNPEVYVVVDETVSLQRANWKLWWDNACECYHCPTIHGESFAAAFLSSADAYHLEKHGLFTATAIDPKQSPSNAKAAITIHLYPGCHIVQQQDIMIMARIVPTAVNAYTVHTTYLAETNASRDAVDAWVKIWKQTYEEDKEAVQRQQRGLESGRTLPFSYTPSREEQPIHHVDNTLREYERIMAEAS